MLEQTANGFEDDSYRHYIRHQSGSYGDRTRMFFQRLIIIYKHMVYMAGYIDSRKGL